MAYRRICSLDDIWEGEMQSFQLGKDDILVVHAEGGVVRAFDNICPHQDAELSKGTLEGYTLTCPAHLWQFDAMSGEGVNPAGCRLKQYAIKQVDGELLVDTDAVLVPATK